MIFGKYCPRCNGTYETCQCAAKAMTTIPDDLVERLNAYGAEGTFDPAVPKAIAATCREAATALLSAQEQIEKLTAATTQWEELFNARSSELFALRDERDQLKRDLAAAQEREIVVRWDDGVLYSRAFIGKLYVGCFNRHDLTWFSALSDDEGEAIDEPSARAAVQSAALEALTKEK